MAGSATLDKVVALVEELSRDEREILVERLTGAGDERSDVSIAPAALTTLEFLALCRESPIVPSGAVDSARLLREIREERIGSL